MAAGATQRIGKVCECATRRAITHIIKGMKLNELYFAVAQFIARRSACRRRSSCILRAGLTSRPKQCA
jgi:hypothetical protein